MPMYLKKKDGQEFGPVNMVVMKEWAAQGRVEPSDVVSEDRDSWKPAPEYNELGMEWVIDLPDGQEYGPVNAFALVNLLRDELLRPESEIRRKDQDLRAVTSEVLRDAMLERQRQLERLETAPETDARQPEAPEPRAEGLERIPSVTELIQAHASLMEEAGRWREMYESAREEARRREDMLVARLDEISEVRTGSLRDEELPGLDGFDADLDHIAPAQLRRRYYAAHKEARKWQVMYEQERSDARERESRLNLRIEEFRKSEAEMRSMLSATTRRLSAVEENYARLVQAAESKNGDHDVAVAGQLGGMLQAYSDLSESYDTLFAQLEQRDGELAAAIEARKDLERVAEERFTELEEMVYREQKAAVASRQQLISLQTTYHQLVRSYREMNDRFIAWRQRYGVGSGHGASGDKQTG